MADIVRKPAIKIAQGNHALYAACFTISDFLRGDNFYRVEKLDPDKGTGYQRILEEGRAKSLAKDLSSAAAKGEAFLPTSILLATEGQVDYDDATKEIVFSANPADGICPFDVVDGQHRIEGLRQFAGQTPGNDDFPVAVNVAAGLNDARQKLHFLTVNTKQKSVDKGLAQHITADFIKMEGFEDLPYLPPWLQREVDKETDLPASEIVAYLSGESDSPWCGRIARVNAPKDKRHTIKEHAFIKSLKAYVLTANNPLARKRPDRRNQILKYYWRAVASTFVTEGKPSVVFKTNGVDFFHYVSAEIIGRCDELGDWKIETIRQIFQDAQAELGDANYMLPNWWESGNTEGAAGTNKGPITRYAHELSSVIRDMSIASDDDSRYESGGS